MDLNISNSTLSTSKVLPFAAKSVALYEDITKVSNSVFGSMLRLQKFEVRIVSREYFKYLVKDEVDTFLGDVESCALLSLRSLEVLGISHKGWIKVSSLKQDETNPVDESRVRKLSSQLKWPLWNTVMPQVPLQNLKDVDSDGNIEDPHRLVQCLLVDEEIEDFVMFVNSDLYSNIQKSLSEKPKIPFFLNAQDAYSSNKPVLYYPEIAVSATVSFVRSSFDCQFEDINEILQVYFEKPRYLVKDDVFSVDLKEVAYPLSCSVNYFDVSYVYFKVSRVNYQQNVITMYLFNFLKFISGD